MLTSKDPKESGKPKGAPRKTPLGIERRFDRFGDWLDDSWMLRKASPVLDKNPKFLLVLTWLMRIAVGSVFIVSGLSKGIDPWGTYYKTSEYLIAMHVPIDEWGNAVVAIAFLLFSVEFITGVSLLLGCYRKVAPITAALFMLVMLPLTLWIAIADPVADCGCFGDFLVISNWATFFKNCLISIAVVWLLKFNSDAPCLIAPYAQWLATVGIAAYIVAVGYIGYWQQPTIDFRPYKTGTLLFSENDDPEYEPEYLFVYEKNGIEKKFGEDDELPEEKDGWTFIRREEQGFVKNGTTSDVPASADTDFRVWSEDGEEDVTQSLSGYERQLMLLVPDINGLSMATSWKINRLYDMSQANDTEFFAVVAGSPGAIEEWRDLSSGQYAIYTAEDTSIKELARGNPALVGLDHGRIKWKSALSALRLDDREEDDVEISTYPVGMGMTGEEALMDLTLLLISLLGALMLLSLLRGRFASRKERRD
ncbi:MAG: DoxX family protein [Muribaculaceae bacterium]|nr:DoxX family protein [Muribaculaceae bacterium]